MLRMKPEMIEHPSVRVNLTSFLYSLSDATHQQFCWVEGKTHPNGEFDNFDMVVSFLFDDTDFAQAPEREIGQSLYDANEAARVNQVCVAIDHMLNKYGTDKRDQFYIATPDWANVMALSLDCLRLLTENDRLAHQD